MDIDGTPKSPLVTRSTIGELLLPEGDAAAELQLSPKTMQAWRVQGCGPRFVKLGRRVLYRASDLKSFVEGNVFASTSEVDHARRCSGNPEQKK